MLNIFKRQSAESEDSHKASTSLLGKFKQGLQRTRSRLGQGLANIVLGKKVIDEALLEKIEEQLLTADVGVNATQTIIQRLTDRVDRKQLADGEALYQALENELLAILMPCQQALSLQAPSSPFVLLLVGVNGAGKTTTIGKLAKQFQRQGKSVLLAAGDTFRAAAIEQLQTWGKVNAIPVIAQQPGADSASVIYDAMQAAKARGVDMVIADTAGRLHTQSHLMDELKKIKRVIQKCDPLAPHEVMLVLDASIGQNAIRQAEQFQEAVGVSGIALTKLDGTAKGGVVIAIAQQCQLPIRFVGVGEKIDDLQPFDAKAFIEAIFE